MSEEVSNHNKSSQSSVKTDGGNVHPFWRFLYLLVAPYGGWKRLKNAGYTADYYARVLFYPLLALMAVARFALLVYGADVSVSVILQQAIGLFVAGFAGYYATIVLARSFLPREARIKIETRFGKVYVMTCLSGFALCMTVFELIPGIGMVFAAAPIYVTYLMVKGVRYLRIPKDEETPTIILLILLIIGIPTAIYTVLEMMMPTA